MNLKIMILSATLVIAPACYASSEGMVNKIENKAEIRKKRLKLAKGYAAYAYGALCGFGSLVLLGKGISSVFNDTNNQTVFTPPILDPVTNTLNYVTDELTERPRTWGNSINLFVNRSLVNMIGAIGFLHCAVKILKYAEKQLEEGKSC